MKSREQVEAERELDRMGAIEPVVLHVEPRHVTVKEAAAMLCTTPDAIRRRITRGSLPGVKDGRRWLVPVSALEGIVGPIVRRGGDLRPRAGNSPYESRGLREETRMEKKKCTPTKDRVAKFTIRKSTKGAAKYEASFYLSDGQRLRRRSPHATKADTERWAAASLAELEKLQAEPAADVPKSVGEACDRWLATQETDTRNKLRFTKWIKAVWGAETLLSDLTHEDLVGFSKELGKSRGEKAKAASKSRRSSPTGRRREKGKGLSKATARQVAQRANAVLAFAHEMGWCRRMKVPLPKVAAKQPEWFTVEELQALLGVAEDPWLTCYMLGGRLGLRRGEICELRKSDFDLTKGTVRISRNYRKDDAGEWEVSTTKGKDSRTLVLDPVLLDFLKPRLERLRHGDLVASIDGEQRIHPPKLTEQARADAVRAGVDRPGVAVHTLRHSWCTHLAAAGAATTAIQAAAGHKDPKTTAIYLHCAQRDAEAVTSYLPPITGNFVETSGAEKEKAPDSGL